MSKINRVRKSESKRLHALILQNSAYTESACMQWLMMHANFQALSVMLLFSV